MTCVSLLAVEAVIFLLLAALPGRFTSRARVWALGALAVAIAATWGSVLKGEADQRQTATERLEAEIPRLGRPEDGFVSSQTCRACHPSQFESWSKSYHRTMTQLATPDTVVGRFKDVSLTSGGRSYRLERRGEEFWAEMVDPDWERQLVLAGVDPDRQADPPRAERQVVMTTGSHHMQTYWVTSGFGREVYNLPFVYLFEQDRWLPREAVFLRPPGARRFFAMWNNSCIDCHSTAGNVGFDFDEEVFDSRVAEMGIACEACHGPAEEHVRLNRDPLRRYRLHFGDEDDPTVVQPEKLDPRPSSEVCAQCHSVSLSDEMDWLANGYRYHAGEDLEDTRYLVRPAVEIDSERMRELAGRDPAALASRFWSDGMVRVSGREYSGMLESGCHQNGDLTCLSCHSMHESDPDDQLGEGMEGDQACLQCHEELRSKVEEHTHHPAASSGSGCYNCHMPHTTYGLLKAIRSHWIDSPSVATSVETGRPNACNLCHLDRTLAWSDEHLSRWYGLPRTTVAQEDTRVAASVQWLLTGDAGQRALIAWAMGWPPAQGASGAGWLAPYLGHLLTDPYATVRYIAARSLRTLPGFGQLEYDFVQPEAQRVAAREAVLDRWFALPAETLDRTGPELLIDARGDLDYDLLRELSRRRDDRPLFLAE